MTEINLEMTYDQYQEIARYTAANKPWIFENIDMVEGNVIRKIDLHIRPKDYNSKRYLIKVEPHNGTPCSCFIDKVVLTGEHDDLIEKMKDINFVTSLGIHESFYFEKFSLVDKDSVEFPEYC